MANKKPKRTTVKKKPTRKAVKKKARLPRPSQMDQVELLAIIEKAAREGALSLDLSAKGITQLPEQIGQLTNLQLLHLGGNQLSTLPEQIGQLVNLQRLDLSQNRLSTLPEQIAQLANLQELKVYGNQLTTLPEQLGRLTNLRTLFLDGNQLKRLPRSIGKLERLNQLDLGDDVISWGNPLVDLPVEIRNLTQLKRLDVSGCPQLNLPPEIVAKYDSPQEILDYYFRAQTQPARPLNEAKVLVVGEAEVGKTSLIKQLFGIGEFDLREDQTHGIVIHRHDLTVKSPHPGPLPEGEGDRTVRLNVWDFGGQEIMHATHQFFLTKRSLYLLVLDSRQNELQSRIEYWLKLIHSFGADSPVIVVCNKCDQQQMDLDWSGLQEKYPQIKGFIRRVSCYYDKETADDRSEGLDDVRAAIAEQIATLEHVLTIFPETWFKVKQRLEAMSESYMPYTDYSEMCRDNDIIEESEQRQLIEFLHDLGIVLHFSDHPLLRDTNVLNPLWVTNAVYRILNCNELFQSHGVLLFRELGTLLKSVETKKFKYPEDRRLFVIEMMRRFELCFDFEGHANEQFLIPGLLPLAAPDTGGWTGSLGFQYRYEVLPQSVMSRFIVRMNELISERTYWRKGVVLASEGNRALVKADFEDARIDIRVEGPVRSRRRLLKSIRDQFGAIHATIPRLGDREFVPIADGPNPAVSYKRLCGLERQGIGREYIEEIDDFISVAGLLDGVDERDFDVFLSHNSQDKPDVRRLNVQLKKRGLKPWLDEEQLTPGRPWIHALEEIVRSCRCAIVCVGPNGLGPWQEPEMEGLLIRFSKEKKHDPGGESPVIPVLLPKAPARVELPLFLQRFTWVNLRGGLRKAGIDKLVWGITGQKP